MQVLLEQWRIQRVRRDRTRAQTVDNRPSKAEVPHDLALHAIPVLVYDTFSDLLEEAACIAGLLTGPVESGSIVIVVMRVQQRSSTGMVVELANAVVGVGAPTTRWAA